MGAKHSKKEGEDADRPSSDTSALLKRRITTARELLRDESAEVRSVFEGLVDRNMVHQGDAYKPLGGDTHTRVVLLQRLYTQHATEGDDELDGYGEQMVRAALAKATMHRPDAALKFADLVLNADGMSQAKDGAGLRPNVYHVAALYLLRDQELAARTWRKVAPKLSTAHLWLSAVSRAVVELTPLFGRHHDHLTAAATRSATQSKFREDFLAAHFQHDDGV